ncbi:MAG: hypothetical protein O7B23_13610 [Deltaproteobacteria bacterium]|nr:hypothetical protein [Deltaproteobacteria bacterium]
MRSAHPFRWLSDASQRRALPLLIVLALIGSGVMTWLDYPLRTAAAPFGIGSFELAKTLAQSQSVLTSWDPSARIYAGLSLGIDYLYLVLYSASIALACVRLARALQHRSARLATLGIALAWAQPVAAGLDAIENYALIRLLLGSLAAAWPLLAWACALPKFTLVAAGLLYVLLAGVYALVVRSSTATGGS